MMHYPEAEESTSMMYVFLPPFFLLSHHQIFHAGQRSPTNVSATKRLLATKSSSPRSRRQPKANMMRRSLRASLSSTSTFFHFVHRYSMLTAHTLSHRHVLKTNFYQPTKVALSFRLAPDFLPDIEYPKKPFGIFFVIGTSLYYQRK
jgi:NAD-specific glutamate dehydrogenase